MPRRRSDALARQSEVTSRTYLAESLIAKPTLFAVLLMCTWAAGAFAAFPEMLPLAMRATGIAAPYGLAAAIVGGFSPMISTSVASNRGLVGVGCPIAAMTLSAGAATIGMKETAYRSLRER